MTALDRMAVRWPDLQLASIFFGGGTPALMAPHCVADLVAKARRLWACGDPLEITLEANPTGAEQDRFHAFADAGITRLSLGVQSLRPEALTFLGRWHGPDDSRRAYERARKAFGSVSVDMIYALPDQSVAAWSDELAEILAWAPDHLSAYHLTIEPGTAFATQVAKGRWQPMEADHAADLYRVTQDQCAAVGLEGYEISNHARPGHRSIHNQGYWQGRPYLGLGPGAHGRMVQQGRWVETIGIKRPDQWVEDVAAGGLGLAMDQPLSSHDRAVERLMLGLRQADGLWLDEELRLAINQPVLERLSRQRMIRLRHDILTVMPEHRLLTDGIISELLS